MVLCARVVLCAVPGAEAESQERVGPGFPGVCANAGQSIFIVHRITHVISMVVSDRTAMRMSVFTQNAFIPTGDPPPGARGEFTRHPCGVVESLLYVRRFTP